MVNGVREHCSCRSDQRKAVVHTGMCGYLAPFLLFWGAESSGGFVMCTNAPSTRFCDWCVQRESLNLRRPRGAAQQF